MLGTNVKISELRPKLVKEYVNMNPEFNTKIVGSFTLSNGKMYLNGVPKSVYKPYFDEPSSVTTTVEMEAENTVNYSGYRKIDNLLEYIDEKKTSLNLSNIDFVCARHTLKSVMKTPKALYRSIWGIMAIKHENTIYLGTYNKDTYSAPQNPDGYQFENFLLTDPGKEQPEDTKNKQHFNVYKCDLNGLKILYSAEIDGILEKEEIKEDSRKDTKYVDLNKLTYIEIKLCCGCKDSCMLFRWWLQCRLANVEHILLGKYTRDEVKNVAQVKKLVIIDTDDIPKIRLGRVKLKATKFHPLHSAAFEFCSEFLRLVSETVEETDTVYAFEYPQKKDTDLRVRYGPAVQSNADAIAFAEDMKRYVK